MLIFSPTSSGLRTGSPKYLGTAAPNEARPVVLRAGECGSVSGDAGDLVTLTHDDGGCPIMILAVAEDGSDAAHALGLDALPKMPYPSSGLRDDPLRGWFSSRGRLVQMHPTYRLFDCATEAGTAFTLRLTVSATLWIALPVLAIDVPSGGSITIARQPARRSNGIALPDPLGSVIEEFRVDRGTATAYRVRAGDYVQILDVDGQQCSDFMAMRADALDAGQERFIDGTVSRTLSGRAFPAPGLQDKFFDQDMVPLLSVVQDTVGRHDTFALACTARGYEERGFPGHLNCSDNISAAYQPYGIAQRAAWPAINFFFNSWILPNDDHLRSDEAVSRPGDYVVMRALTDLVCVSTACPDDVDPINGWNPTDIHVRIYSDETPIRHAVAYRPFADAEAVLTEYSAFHAQTAPLTRDFHVARDLWLPRSFAAVGTLGEYWACREAVTVQDLSSLRKFDIAGPDAAALLQYATTRNVDRLPVNRGAYALLCDETGSVIDDGTLFRLAPDVFRWCCGAEESGRHLAALAEARGLKVWVRALHGSMPNLAVQGPRSRDLLSRLVHVHPGRPALDDLKWFGMTIARLRDREGPAFMLTRTGYTGELGYEIFCDTADAPAVWDALFEAGADLGVSPMGSAALDILRTEAGFMAAGAEFAAGVVAVEAGLGFAVDMRKPEFVGRAALERALSAPRQKLVGLAFDGDEVPGPGAPVLVGTRPVGEVTSAVHSPMLGHGIAMARVAVEHAEPAPDGAATLEVGALDHHRKRMAARIVGVPFVDPERTRPRA